MTFNLLIFRQHSFPLGYIAAAFLVAIAALLTNAMWYIVDRPISTPMFVAAIAGSAWLGGIRVGVFASLLAGVLIDYYFFAPLNSFSGTRDELIRLSVFLTEGSLMSWLIERHKVGAQDLRRSREELRELTLHQQEVRESEQKRIALEIHDELGQALTGLKMDSHFLRRRLGTMDPEYERFEALRDIDRLSTQIDNTISTVRRISAELRPSILDDFGLVAASEWHVREFQLRTSIECRFTSDLDELDLGADANTAVFRILQESLTNVARHASATSVSISILNLGDEVIMSVVDNGKGIASVNLSEHRSLGILGMRERSRLVGAQFEILDNPGGGTMVNLRIPVRERQLQEQLI